MTKLQAVLGQYDGWSLPHPGAPEQLSRKERAQNLAHVAAIKDASIVHLRSALPALDAQFAALLDPAIHPFDAVCELDRWWVKTGLQLRLFPPVAGGLKSILFRGRYFAGNEVIARTHWYRWPDHPLVKPLDALLRDMALIIGDAIVLRRPDFAWMVNEGATERRTQTMQWGRVVVMRPASADRPANAFDLFALARWSYTDLHNRKRNGLNMDAVNTGGGNWAGTFFGWAAINVINGGYTNDHYPQGRDGAAVAGRWQ